MTLRGLEPVAPHLYQEWFLELEGTWSKRIERGSAGREIYANTDNSGDRRKDPIVPRGVVESISSIFARH